MGNTQKKQTRFLIRNELHEVILTTSQEDLIPRIKQGEFTGQEEICEVGNNKWEKLSSHPAFYDVFLKRLFSDGYQARQGNPSPSEPSRSNARLFQTQMPADSVVEPPETRNISQNISTYAGKTSKALPPEIKERPGVTIHQSDIEKLFTESDAQTKNLAEEKLSRPLIDDATTELPRIDANVEGVIPEPVEKKTNGSGFTRRTWLLVLVLFLGLFALFNMGTEQKPIKNAEETIAAPGFLVLARGNINAEARTALLEALEEETRFFLWNDGPRFCEGAMEAAQEALKYDETNGHFWGLYAVAGARRLGSYGASPQLLEGVRKAILKGRELDRHSSLLYRAEAILQMNEGKWKEAREKIAAAIESDPTDLGNSLVEGEIEWMAGNREQGFSKIKEVVEIEPNNVRGHYLASLEYLSKGDWDRAWSESIESLRWNRLYANAFFILGEVQARRNELSDAKVSYDQATRFTGFGDSAVVARAHARLGKILEGLGKTADADKSYALAFFYSPVEFKEYQSKKAFAESDGVPLEEVAKGWAFEKHFFREQADELFRQKKYPEALRFYQAARLIQPNDGNALVKVGQVLEKVVTSYTQIQKVMLIYERAIERDPKNSTGYIKLGLLETDQYNFDRALRLLEYGANLDPENAEVYLALGKHYFKRQDFGRAKEYFVKSQTLDATNSESEYYSGLLIRLFNKDEIREPLRRFYRAYTLDPENYIALAEWLKLKVLNYEKTFAIKFVKNLIEHDPKNADLQWVLGEIYTGNNESRRAISYYQKALDLDPASSRVRMSLGKAHALLGDYEAAVDEYRKSSELDQRNTEGRFEAAKILYELQKYPAAEEDLRKIIERKPNFPGVHRYLSKVYQSKVYQSKVLQAAKRKELSAEDQRTIAMDEMQKEVENNPLNTRFVIEFATLLMEYKKFEEAIKQLSAVTNLSPADTSEGAKKERMRGFLLLSMCYRALERAESAEGAVRLALTLEPQEPELHRELGYVYHALQRHREAAEAFTFYLNRVPAASDAAEIKGIIKKTINE